MSRVVLVTVTYNSSDNLKVLLEHISNYSSELYKIIVVDNASSAAHAESIKALCDQNGLVEVIKSDQNIGGAGGFCLGIQKALQYCADEDYIWLMDDDAFPNEDTLKILLNYRNLPNIGALCPLIRGIETGGYQFYHHKIEEKYLNRDIAACNDINELGEVTRIEANSFVGPLIPVQVIRDIGFPDSELFIEGDDTEYTYRISRKYSIYLIKESEINHRDLVNLKGHINRKGLWKNYYHKRNRTLFVKTFALGRKSRIIGVLLVAKNTLGDIYGILTKREYAGIRRISIELIMKGIRDGLRGTKGKTIDPQVFFNSLDA